jgi:hypothetical protein
MTAVDFLVEKYNYINWLRNRDEISAETADKFRNDYLQQAKQMEKEQLELRHKDGTPMRKYNSPKLQEIKMENKQQTAVMALAKAFREWQKEWDRFDKEKTKQPKLFDEFIEPFLEMEKEQIIEAYNTGYEDAKCNHISDSDNYFNQKYKAII